MTLDDLKANVDFEKFIVDLGYTLDKKRSTRQHRIYEKNGDKVCLKQGDKYVVYFSIHGPDSGTIIDFCKARESEVLANCQGNNSLEKAYNRLMNFIGRQNEIKISTQRMIPGETKKDFSLTDDAFVIPKSKDINSRDFSYLKRRCISGSVLGSPVFSNTGLSKNDYGFYNLAFPLFNTEDEIKGVVYRYYNPTSKEHKKIFLKGSDKLNAISLSTLDYKNASEIIICESDIDCMSHYQLFKNQQKDLLYIACEGYLTKGQTSNILSHVSSIKEYRKEHKASLPTITMAFDNDENGQAYTTAILFSLLENEAISVSPDSIERADGTKMAFSFSISLDKIKNDYSELLENVPGIRIGLIDNNFKITIPRDMQSLSQANKALLSISKNVGIDRSMGKDFNEDLQVESKKKDRSVGKSI